MVVKAKTGTGKTLAFLIPAVEQVQYRLCLQVDIMTPYLPGIGKLNVGVNHSKPATPPQMVQAWIVLAAELSMTLPHACLQLMANPLPRGKTGVLVISPTRELASQIAEEAKVLATFHKLTVQVRRVVCCA